MLTKISDLPERVIGVRASGEVTRQDYETVMEPLLRDMHKSGKRIGFLYQFGNEFESLSSGAAWEDFKVGMQYLRLFDKCAVVTDVNWLRQSCRFLKTMSPFPFKVFGTDEYGKAIDWLATPAETEIPTEMLVDKGVLVVEPERPLRKTDFDAISAAVDPQIEEKGSLHGLVVHTHSFPGWDDFGTFIRHMEFVHDHHKKVRKVAVAADGSVAELVPSLARHFVEADIRHFPYAEKQAAIDWASS